MPAKWSYRPGQAMGHSRCRCVTRVQASPLPIRPSCFRNFSRPTMRSPARKAAPAWGSLYPNASSGCTAAKSGSSQRSAKARHFALRSRFALRSKLRRHEQAHSGRGGRDMGVLIEGVWRDEELPQETGRTGEFRRADSIFRDRITADGASGFKAEAGRYHLYVAHGCPWAHRTLIYRALKKLDGAITVAYSIPGLREQGWTFENNRAFPDCTPDTVNGFHYL